MNSNYLNVEFWRIMLVIFIALLGGILSHQWLLSLCLTLVVYIVWLLYKLHQLQKWLEGGAKAKHAIDNSGLWGSITQQIQFMQKQSNERKKHMGKLLKRSQRIITGLPYAAIVLNKHNEIDWANKISANSLNIDIKKDRGQRIENLIRLPEFRQALNEQVTTEIEYSPPQNVGQKLALQLIFVHKDLKLLIAQDISERENILQMRKNFIANASHELRTPLTVISGYLEIMYEEIDFPENLQIPLLSAMDQSVRMQRIIEDLLILLT
jgi:two-component system phosphate regulon sensor histidine kinase PhoR